MAGFFGNIVNQGINQMMGIGNTKRFGGLNGYYGPEKDGVAHGYGRLYVDGQLKYEGDFSKGVFHGKGIYFTTHEPTGHARKFYKGQFMHGEFHGYGKLYDIHTGKVAYKGRFIHGKAKPSFLKKALSCFMYTKVY